MMLGIISMVALIGTLGSQGTPATPTTPAIKQTSSAAAQAPTVAPKDADILIKDALADAKSLAVLFLFALQQPGVAGAA